MQQYSKEEIDDLMLRFDQQEVSREEWTHEAHLVLAIWLNWKFNEEDALNRARDLIIAHNEAVGTPNTTEGGYHETLTVFWIKRARQFIDENNFVDVYQAIDDFIGCGLHDNDYPLNFYTWNHLFSKDARMGYVEPDSVG